MNASNEAAGNVPHFDVLIVGAGISGIGAAYHLQTNCPGKSYAIVEGRERMGGTWDLFRYPGIRSDSDMYTLGFAFRPWENPAAIADGPSILSYIQDTASAYGIDQHIRYQHLVRSASWSTADARWTVVMERGDTGEQVVMTSQFLFMCAGYYDYRGGYTPEFEGSEDFQGQIVHPQQWSDEVDYAGKKVVVIGSGATAVTLIPSLAEKAEHVTMLQRSPTYVVSMPGEDAFANFLRRILPSKTAYAITRWKNVLFQLAFFHFCRRFPNAATKLLLAGVKQGLGESVDIGKHFKPRYKPWDQRLCLVPDADLYKVLRSGKASVVTDQISRFTPKGIELESGETLDADLIVTATGLKLRFIGGVDLEVDGRAVEPGQTMSYKGLMCSDVPNLVMALGYTNASWTLKVDLTFEWVCRLLNDLDAKGKRIFCARPNPEVEAEPMLALTSGYILRSIDELPKQGTVPPWRLHNNYARDLASMRFGSIDDDSLELA